MIKKFPLASKLLVFQAAAILGTAQAATVAQFVGYADGDGGQPNDESIAFDVINSNSILIATLYVDAADQAVDFTSVTFGGVAPDATYGDSRLYSFMFLNPSTDDSLSFDFQKATNGGVAAVLYEISGANLNLSNITVEDDGVDTITTTTADELVLSFAGRNGNNVPATVSGSSIFTDEDFQSNTEGPIVGGGALASASATPGSIGSQNITWISASHGRIAFAFEPIPEPSSALLGGLGCLLLLRRRRA